MKRIRTIISILLVITGIVSVVFGFIIKGKDYGSFGRHASFGGDFYTIINDNATSIVSNTRYIIDVLSDGLGYILIIAGVVIILTSLRSLFDKGEVADKLSLIERNTRCSKVNNAESSSKPAAAPVDAPEHESKSSSNIYKARSSSESSISSNEISQQIVLVLGVTLLQSGSSVIIKEVNPGSIAEKSCLCENDKLLEINGTEITNIDIARYTVIHRTKPGQTVPFVIERDGVKMALNVTF